MPDVNLALQRLSLLTGRDALKLLAETRVILFGVGGVGSWCAEALVRSGIGSLTIVDSDLVCVTNINRQVQATVRSVGRSKTAELRRRLRAIHPGCTIRGIHARFDQKSADRFGLGDFDYVIDCIDSIVNKVELIIRASDSGARVFTALGAACKLDPTRIAVGSLWDSYNCPLGKYVRKKLRQRGFTGEVTCVYSPEECRGTPGETLCATGECPCPKTGSVENPGGKKKQINGSAVHVTGIFGFMLAGLVVQDVVKRAEGRESADW